MRKWTLEERQHQSKLIHEWAPWASSTGAVTADGKAICAKNSYKHGGCIAELRKLSGLFAAQKKSLKQIPFFEAD